MELRHLRYFVAVAAVTFGIVSLRLPSFTAVIRAYAAIGVLAFVIRDYAYQPTNARPATRRSLRVERRPAAHAYTLTNPAFHAN